MFFSHSGSSSYSDLVAKAFCLCRFFPWPVLFQLMPQHLCFPWDSFSNQIPFGWGELNIKIQTLYPAGVEVLPRVTCEENVEHKSKFSQSKSAWNSGDLVIGVVPKLTVHLYSVVWAQYPKGFSHIFKNKSEI